MIALEMFPSLGPQSSHFLQISVQQSNHWDRWEFVPIHNSTHTTVLHSLLFDEPIQHLPSSSPSPHQYHPHRHPLHRRPHQLTAYPSPGEFALVIPNLFRFQQPPEIPVQEHHHDHHHLLSMCSRLGNNAIPSIESNYFQNLSQLLEL